MLNDKIILLVEDDPNDVLLIQRAFQKAGLNNSLKVVRNGEQAVEYLSGEDAYADRERFPLPFLVLLDLKMPGTDGFEVLAWTRSVANLKRLLVVVLTSSNLQADVDKAYELGANSYLVKPGGFDKLEEIVHCLEDYWLKLNRCPDFAVESAMPGPGMRVVLRDSETRQYFKGPNDWTDDPEQALNFERGQRAMQSAQRLKLPRFEVIVDMVCESETTKK